MWRKFTMCLGKIVQRVLKIFNKRGSRRETPIMEDSSFIGQSVSLNSGEIFIGGTSFGKVDSIEIVETPQIKMEKKISYSPLTLLPKRIPTKALILSVDANASSEYIATDISQLESRGIAHIIIGRPQSQEELIQEYERRNGALDDEFRDELLEQEGNLVSAIIPGATLLYYEDLGIWDWEEPEE